MSGFRTSSYVLSIVVLLLGFVQSISAFTPNGAYNKITQRGSTSLSAESDDHMSHMNRRAFGLQVVTGISSGLLFLHNQPPAFGEVFFDPAQYGDQELRVGAVDSVRESVRRAILQNPTLAPSFYQLALLDGLSYNAQTKAFGPDGKVVINVLTSKQTDPYTSNLQKACLALIETEKALRKKTAISIADAIAIGGAEAIESIGGPVLPVQLGRADTPKDGIVPSIPIDLFAGTRPLSQVTRAFTSAGLTEREMTALLSALLTLERVEKTRTAEDWKQSVRPKFREAGKMGRMSDFKALTEEDIKQAEIDAELENSSVSGDDDWYIADSFGSRDDRFGQRLAKDDISEKNFNKYLKELQTMNKKTGSKSTDGKEDYGWISELLLDPQLPTVQTWMTKYAGTNLAYIKDLSIAYNSVTQLGAVYTGGKYESLLKNRPRRSLNDDDLNLFN